MYSYPLRGVTLEGKGYHDFTVADGICSMDQNKFFLMGRPCSPLMRTKTLYRGTESGEFFEGDLVRYEKVIYMIAYQSGGFVAVSDNHVLPAFELSGCKVVSSAILTSPELICTPKSIQFKYEDLTFVIYRMKGIRDSQLVIGCDGWRMISPELVKQNAYLCSGKNAIYFGDETANGTVVMHKGRVCHERDGKFTEIITIGG